MLQDGFTGGSLVEEEMTCESLALTPGEEVGPLMRSARTMASVSPVVPAPASERQACTASRLFHCHRCTTAFAKQTNYRRHLRRHRQRDREEVESQDEVQGLLHEFG